ncbi:hypothetical protein CERSUDRAFT_119793 [Gelatoporia subvermispora B]|uniref:F-box domain-containing protein n=1 Tax=Ceriporiopsis subvermispora (strain B) TaxID=914234 RepID=M2QZN6_CERS8|nr:hypothetical protein CERSUDRAFT_119793 [Gelatoporia subvermispora B]
MGYDSTCFISGYPVASCLNHVMTDYRDDLVEARLSGVAHNAYSDAMNRLLQPYTEEDEVTRQDMVLLGPFTPEDAYIHPLDVPREPVDAVRAGLIRAIHDVVPGGAPGDETQEAVFTARETGLKYAARARRHLAFVNAAALRILACAAPALTVQRLWVLKMKSEPFAERGIGGIDYGPVDQGGHYLQLHAVTADAHFDEWMVRLLRHGEPTEEDRWEMMMGAGNMWVFVRPDLFPVAEAIAQNGRSAQMRQIEHHTRRPVDVRPDARRFTFEGLPLDVLLLICSELTFAEILATSACSHRLFRTLSPNIDSVAYARLSRHERWYLPPEEDTGPWAHDRHWFEQRSAAAWAAQETLAGRDVGERRFPWFEYAKACRRSPSMRNRARIWHVAKQLEQLACRYGLFRDT